MVKDIVIVTGGFDPIHSGHIAYIQDASTYGKVVVGVNSDNWLVRKKGKVFMPFQERAAVVQSMRNVMSVIDFDDSDNSACDAINKVRKMYPHNKILFVNGGDRTAENIPEMRVNDTNLEFIFGVGGTNKLNSSSWILKEWQKPLKFSKPWGYYTVLDETNAHVKVKKLHVIPKASLSMQRHFKRNELWFVANGVASLELLDQDKNKYTLTYNKYDRIDIPLNSWHRLHNESEDILEVIEVQYGLECSEEDIERIYAL
jgi:cytidyltransferase-like protein